MEIKIYSNADKYLNTINPLLNPVQRLFFTEEQFKQTSGVYNVDTQLIRINLPGVQYWVTKEWEESGCTFEDYMITYFTTTILHEILHHMLTINGIDNIPMLQHRVIEPIERYLFPELV
jgi:hypothetical protein